MPVTPHSDAGWRIEPPVSVAVAIGARRAATAAAEPPEEPPGTQLRVPGILHRSVPAGLVRRTHGELVHVRLAEHHHARRIQLFDHGGVIGRHEVVEHPRAAARADPLRAEDVLVRERQPGERTGLAGRQRDVGRLGPASAASGVTVMKALSFGCAASMRPSRLFVSSVTENSLARSFFASSASVNVCIFLGLFTQ